jgi:hypothetical protein
MEYFDLTEGKKACRMGFRSGATAVFRHRMTIVYLLLLEYLSFPIIHEIIERSGTSDHGIWDTIVSVFSNVSLDEYVFLSVFALMSPSDVIYLFYHGTIPFGIEMVIVIVAGLAFWSSVIFLIVKCKKMPIARLIAFYVLILGYFWAALEGMAVAIMRFMTV